MPINEYVDDKVISFVTETADQKFEVEVLQEGVYL